MPPEDTPEDQMTSEEFEEGSVQDLSELHLFTTKETLLSFLTDQFESLFTQILPFDQFTLRLDEIKAVALARFPETTNEDLNNSLNEMIRLRMKMLKERK